VRVFASLGQPVTQWNLSIVTTLVRFDQCFTAAAVATEVTAIIATIRIVLRVCRAAFTGGLEGPEMADCSSIGPTSLSPARLLTSMMASRYPAFENLSVRKGHAGSRGTRKLPFFPVRVLRRRQGFPPTVVSDCTLTPCKGVPWSFLPITTPLTKRPSAKAGSGAMDIAASTMAIKPRRRPKLFHEKECCSFFLDLEQEVAIDFRSFPKGHSQDAFHVLPKFRQRPFVSIRFLGP
jgi:hypothetical protein